MHGPRPPSILWEIGIIFVIVVILILRFSFMRAGFFSKMSIKYYATFFVNEMELNMVLVDSFLHDMNLQQDTDETEYEYHQRLYTYYPMIADAINTERPEWERSVYRAKKRGLKTFDPSLSQDIHAFYEDLSDYDSQLEKCASLDHSHDAAAWASQVMALATSRRVLLEQGKRILEELAKV